jgi:hypothetical protein
MLCDRVPGLNEETIANLCHSRVFCVTEECDNQVMWAHYADEHRGAVFKLRCGNNVDTSLNVALKVEYSDKFVPLPTFSEILADAAGYAELDIRGSVPKLICSKHRDWAYEKEWRVHRSLPTSQPAGDGFTIYDEPPEAFDSVYLGCRMLPEDIKQVSEAVKHHLPNMKIYRSQVRKDSFGLTFEPL